MTRLTCALITGKWLPSGNGGVQEVNSGGTITEGNMKCCVHASGQCFRKQIKHRSEQRLGKRPEKIKTADGISRKLKDRLTRSCIVGRKLEGIDTRHRGLW